MAIQLTITVDDTGQTVPNAYGHIDDSSVLLASNTKIILGWYASKAASDHGLKAVRPDVLVIPGALLENPDATFVSGLQAALTAGSITTPGDALKTALYLLIKELPQYAGAVDV